MRYGVGQLCTICVGPGASHLRLYGTCMPGVHCPAWRRAPTDERRGPVEVGPNFPTLWCDGLRGIVTDSASTGLAVRSARARMSHPW